jgi:amidophosphoribosyltransferase
MGDVIKNVYANCKEQVDLPKEQIKNYVKEIYTSFSNEEVSAKIAELLTPADLNAKVEIIYQTVENLHKSCPNNLGDWYFTGNYPTPGGNKIVNKAFINWMEGKNERAY